MVVSGGTIMNIIQIYKNFPTQEDCIQHIENIRWHGNPLCPYCKSEKHSLLPKEKRYHCNNCNTSYSVTVGTIFHDTKLPLQKWFLAISIILNAKKGVASRQLARDIEVTKDTAWRMQMQIRKAMGQHKELLEGIVEMDETYVGGKPRPGTGKHKRGRGTSKIPVVGMVERNGNVKAKVQSKDKLKYKNLRKIVKENIDTNNSILMTDEYRGYSPMSLIIEHKTVNHSTKQYSIGDTHTNTIESFWAILKRGIYGQYYHVSKKHLNKYVKEFCYKYNNRKNEANDVFGDLLRRGVNLYV
jgi:transposase-like protein